MKQEKKRFGFLLGFLMGIGVGLVWMAWADRAFQALSKPVRLAAFCGLFVAYLLIRLALITLHEAGHLIAGWMTGYRLLYYRVFSLTLIRREGRLRLKRFSIPGTGGQCVMSPPAWTDKGIPVFFYNAGGLLANLLTAAALACGVLRLPGDSLAGMLCRMALLIDVYMLLTNGIPMGSNDAANLLALKRDGRLRRVLWQNLTAIRCEADGMTTAEMPDELFELPQDANLAKPQYAATAIEAAMRLGARGDFAAEGETVNALLDRWGDQLPPYDRFLLQNEALFLMCLENRPAKDITSARLGYGESFRRFRAAMSKSPGVIRTCYAEAVLTSETGEALKQAALARRASESYPFPQYFDLARREMDMIDQLVSDKAE